jgi:Tfp pilus assembly protein PilN
MKTRVNLYVPELQPKLEVLTLSFVLVIWGVMLITFGGIYFLNHSNAVTVHEELVKVQVKKTELEDQLVTIKEALSNRQSDPALVAEVEKKQLDLKLKQQIVSELSGQENFKSHGFAALMEGLAEHHQAGLWLTRINIDGNEVRFEGSATESNIIPKWMGQLSLIPRFKSQEFSTTKLYRDEKAQLKFTLGTMDVVKIQEADQL